MIQNQKILQTLLREMRNEAGLRQIDIAKAMKFPQSMVSKYESGERKLDIFEIRQLCGLFGISLQDFIKILENKLATTKK